MKDAVLKDYRTRTPESEKLFERAKKVMAGGVCHNIRYFPPYPFYIKEARGSKVRDVDGNEYIDLWMAHYEAILGHSPEIIVVKECTGDWSMSIKWSSLSSSAR